MVKTKVLIVVTTIFLLLVSVNVIYAEEEQFGITLDCYESCDDKKIGYSKDIMFVLTIKNKLNYWISIGSESELGGADFHITVENINLKNGKGSETYNDFLGKKFFIKPKSELRVYIPFNIYNKIEKDNRLGEWKIYPQLIINDVKFYEDPFELKETPLIYVDRTSFTIHSPVKGNVLEFKAVKPEVEVTGEGFKIPKDVWEYPFNKYILFPIIVLVIVGLFRWFFTRRK